MPKKSPWSNNGGARKGAGRKPNPNAKQSVTLRMSPDIVAWVKSLDNQSVEVEAIIRRCKAFREFDQ